jgi:multiple sugar transport system ATP-binding protein
VGYTIGAVAAIALTNLSKRYAGEVVALDDVSLKIADGEFIVLVGPSGCGKSTLLRLVAGLEEATEGSIAIGGRDVTELAPRHRDIAMVFQTYALYPHMTVRQNLGYGLKVRRTAKAQTERRVNEVAELLGLGDLLDRRPAQLSGGQRQRVAMGRAIAREPQAFLMDEPLSNLDAKLRVGMRASLAQLHDRLGVTTLYVTHDQIEAMTLGQRVAVMRDGRLLQVDTPQRLYAEPRDLFVAAFIGSPAMNLVEATIDGDVVAFGQYRVPLDPGRPRPDVQRVVLGIRPEAFEDAAFAQPGQSTIDVELTVVEELGSDAHLLFPVRAPQITAESLQAQAEDATLLADEESLFTARVDPRTSARPAGRLTLAVDPARFHFFDPDTGESLLAGSYAAGGGERIAEVALG